MVGSKSTISASQGQMAACNLEPPIRPLEESHSKPICMIYNGTIVSDLSKIKTDEMVPGSLRQLGERFGHLVPWLA